jgi:hypothetical protein
MARVLTLVLIALIVGGSVTATAEVVETKDGRTSGEAELVGYNYRPGIPSTIFRDQDVIGAIEMKFFRDTDLRAKILRASELDSFEASIKKLEIIKRGNPRAFCAFVVFSHCCLRFRQDQEKRLSQLSRDANLDLVFRSEVASFGSWFGGGQENWDGV